MGKNGGEGGGTNYTAAGTGRQRHSTGDGRTIWSDEGGGWMVASPQFGGCFLQKCAMIGRSKAMDATRNSVTPAYFVIGKEKKGNMYILYKTIPIKGKGMDRMIRLGPLL